MNQTNSHPPESFETEQSLLGCIIKDGDKMGDILSVLPDQSRFYTPRHQVIFRAAKALRFAEMPIDVTTISEELNKLKVLEKIGGRVYLVELAESIGTTVNATTYAKTIASKYRLRQLIQTCNEIVKSAYMDNEAPEVLAAQLSQELIGLTAQSTGRGFKLIKEHAIELAEHLARIEAGHETLGAQTGFTELDRMTGGLQKSGMYIIAGRPSQGKTALANCIASNMAQQGKRVAIFSAESTAEEYTLRTMCTHAKIDSMRLKRGEVDDWDLVSKSINEISSWDYWIDDTSEIEINSLITKATQIVQKRQIDCIFVDYLQKLRTSERMNSRREEVTLFARSLKHLSRALHIPVVCLSQLSRECERRQNKRPLLSDLRDSGDVEQEADAVMGLFRPELYIGKKKKDEGKYTNLAELIMMKQRNGPIGTIELFFNKVFTRFEDLSYQEMAF